MQISCSWIYDSEKWLKKFEQKRLDPAVIRTRLSSIFDRILPLRISYHIIIIIFDLSYYQGEARCDVPM